jgi:hypothetical protein
MYSSSCQCCDVDMAACGQWMGSWDVAMSCPSGVDLYRWAKASPAMLFSTTFGEERRGWLQKSGVGGVPAGGATRCVKPCCRRCKWYFVLHGAKYQSVLCRYCGIVTETRGGVVERFTGERHGEHQDVLTRSRDHVGLHRSWACRGGDDKVWIVCTSISIVASCLSPASGSATLLLL